MTLSSSSASRPVDCSVIVVTWNRPQLLRSCLRSVLGAIEASGLACEVLVVDNGSTGGDGEVVETEFPEVRLLRSSANLGSARANNLALEVSSGRYLLLVNNDVCLPPNLVSVLCAYLDTNPGVGIAGPRLVLPDGSAQQSWGTFLTPWRACAEALHVGWLTQRLRGRERRLSPGRPLRVEWIAGACFFIRRAVMERVGRLDPRYFFYSEDMDWCRRARDAGWETHFLPHIAVLHNHAATAYSDPQWYARMLREGRATFLRKYYGAWSVAAFRLATLLGSLPLALKWQWRQGAYAARRRSEAKGRLFWALWPGPRGTGEHLP